MVIERKKEMTVGVICALAIEVEGLKAVMKQKTEKAGARMTYTQGTIGGVQAVAVECGIGKVNAAICAQQMIDLFKPDMIINSGIAGALSGQIGIADIVIANDVVQHDMDGTAMGDPLGEIWFHDEKRIEIPADTNIVERLKQACSSLKDTKVMLGRIATGDVFVAGKEKRRAIYDHFGALACEMEGGAIGQVCYRNGVPFGILRCISDDITENEFMDYLKFREIAAKKSIAIIQAFLSQL